PRDGADLPLERRLDVVARGHAQGALRLRQAHGHALGALREGHVLAGRRGVAREQVVEAVPDAFAGLAEGAAGGDLRLAVGAALRLLLQPRRVGGLLLDQLGEDALVVPLPRLGDGLLACLLGLPLRLGFPRALPRPDVLRHRRRIDAGRALARLQRGAVVGDLLELRPDDLVVVLLQQARFLLGVGPQARPQVRAAERARVALLLLAVPVHGADGVELLAGLLLEARQLVQERLARAQHRQGLLGAGGAVVEAVEAPHVRLLRRHVVLAGEGALRVGEHEALQVVLHALRLLDQRVARGARGARRGRCGLQDGEARLALGLEAPHLGRPALFLRGGRGGGVLLAGGGQLLLDRLQVAVRRDELLDLSGGRPSLAGELRAELAGYRPVGQVVLVLLRQVALPHEQ